MQLINYNWVVFRWQWLFYMYTEYEIGYYYNINEMLRFLHFVTDYKLCLLNPTPSPPSPPQTT